MSDQKLILPAYLDSFKTLADKSVKIIFTTQEVNEEQGSAMFSLRGAFGSLIFVAEGVKEVEVPPTPKPDGLNRVKSASERLRHKIYRLWEILKTRSGLAVDFDSYYQARMREFEGKIEQELDAMN